MFIQEYFLYYKVVSNWEYSPWRVIKKGAVLKRSAKNMGEFCVYYPPAYDTNITASNIDLDKCEPISYQEFRRGFF